MGNIFKVDLDYESYLFDPNYSEESQGSIKIIKEFEYIFFLINKNKDACLKNYQLYDQEYLNKLRMLNFQIPHFDSQATEFQYWWGNRRNKKLEMILNSKLTSCEIAKKRGWGFLEGAIVTNLEEINTHIKSLSIPASQKFIIKNPYGFSGIGHYIFDRDFLPLIQFQNPMLLEPVYNRIFDIGITFEILNKKINRMFIVENFNNDKGSFKGGMGSKSLDQFIKIILKKYQFDLSPYIKTYEQICEYYLSIGAESNIQIDSFVYDEQGVRKLYPLVEVNYRKTMGLVIQALADRSEMNSIEWRITHTDKFENLEGGIKLSPPGNRFKSYLKNVDINLE